MGFLPWKREPEFQRRFSLVLGQKNQLWWDLPAYDSFELNQEIYQIPRATFDAKVKELGELLDIEKLLKQPVRKLSLGERMKCELAASLLHSPEVLFLDEPTIGLDLISQSRIREFLREYNERTGLTVILTSHYMADIEALCKRVMVINGGKAVFDGPLGELTERFAPLRRIGLTLKHPPDVAALKLANELGENIEHEGARLSLSVPREKVPERVNQLLANLAGFGFVGGRSRNRKRDSPDVRAVNWDSRAAATAPRVRGFERQGASPPAFLRLEWRGANSRSGSASDG